MIYDLDKNIIYNLRHDSEAEVSRKVWHRIEIGDSNNDFVQAGVSSAPMFEIKDPSLEQIMKFRISTEEPLLNTDESRVCIRELL